MSETSVDAELTFPETLYDALKSLGYAGQVECQGRRVYLEGGLVSPADWPEFTATLFALNPAPTAIVWLLKPGPDNWSSEEWKEEDRWHRAVVEAGGTILESTAPKFEDAVRELVGVGSTLPAPRRSTSAIRVLDWSMYKGSYLSNQDFKKFIEQFQDTHATASVVS